MRKGDFRISLGQRDFKAPDSHSKTPLNCGTSSDFASTSPLNCILLCWIINRKNSKVQQMGKVVDEERVRLFRRDRDHLSVRNIVLLSSSGAA